MKIQCDVCNKDEASVYCSADEAALCAACDHRVHHANKLAGKHHRFSLLHPSPPHHSPPLCDICQERRAFLFCQQDRAILCRECDIPIHKASEHTQKHNRFLLTGVKLSPTSSLYSPSPSSDDSVPNLKSPIIVPQPPNPPPPIAKNPKSGTALGSQNQSTTSSISEYLIEMLPGWHVEDFLDSSPPPFGFSKNVDENQMSPFWDTDLDSSNLGTTNFSSENLGIWVPQGPSPPSQHNSYTSQTTGFGGAAGLHGAKEGTTMKSSRKWRDDGCFTVPQISPHSTASKRSRNFW